MDDGARRTVTVRLLLLSVLAASVLSVGTAVGLSYALIGTSEPGPRGPAGEQGSPGGARTAAYANPFARAPMRRRRAELAGDGATSASESAPVTND
jgi:hypothetical protein